MVPFPSLCPLPKSDAFPERVSPQVLQTEATAHLGETMRRSARCPSPLSQDNPQLLGRGRMHARRGRLRAGQKRERNIVQQWRTNCDAEQVADLARRAGVPDPKQALRAGAGAAGVPGLWARRLTRGASDDAPAHSLGGARVALLPHADVPCAMCGDCQIGSPAATLRPTRSVLLAVALAAVRAATACVQRGKAVQEAPHLFGQPSMPGLACKSTWLSHGSTQRRSFVSSNRRLHAPKQAARVGNLDAKEVHAAERPLVRGVSAFPGAPLAGRVCQPLLQDGQDL